MLKGGYQIVDLKGIELTDDGYYFEGLYNKLVNNHDKTILLANISIWGGDKKDYFVQPIIDYDYDLIKCTIGDYTFKCSTDDYVWVDYGIIGGGETGSNSYTDLDNKPSINNNTLTGNKTSDQLGLQSKLTIGEGVIRTLVHNLCIDKTKDLSSLIAMTSGSSLDIKNLFTSGGWTVETNIIPSEMTGSKYVFIFTLYTYNDGDYSTVGQIYCPFDVVYDSDLDTKGIYNEVLVMYMDFTSLTGGWAGFAKLNVESYYNSTSHAYDNVTRAILTRL